MPTTPPFGRWKRLLVLLLAASLLPLPPAGAITFREEEELSQEILRYIFRRMPVIDDPYITAYVDRVGRRLLAGLSDQPFRYRFYVIQQDAFNAFATPAGHVFIYSGLIAAMEGEEELAGILGHEIAHVACRHISQKIDLAKKVGWAQLAGMAAGMLLGVAAGSGAAATATMMGSAAAGATIQLAFSRENESQADHLGLQYLREAGYGAEGLLATLRKIRARQAFGKGQVPTYMLTHPAIEDRISAIANWIEEHPEAGRKGRQGDPAAWERFLTRILTETTDPSAELARQEEILAREPDQALARHRRALLLLKLNRPAEAGAELQRLLAKDAFNPWLLRDLGRAYFQAGRLEEAASLLETALRRLPQDPDTLLFLGRVRQETGRPEEAIGLFRELTRAAPDFREGHYFLGQALGREGRLGEAHYTLGVYHFKSRDFKTAAIQFRNGLRHAAESDLRERLLQGLQNAEREIQAEKKMQDG